MNTRVHTVLPLRSQDGAKIQFGASSPQSQQRNRVSFAELEAFSADPPSEGQFDSYLKGVFHGITRLQDPKSRPITHMLDTPRQKLFDSRNGEVLEYTRGAAYAYTRLNTPEKQLEYLERLLDIPDRWKQTDYTRSRNMYRAIGALGKRASQDNDMVNRISKLQIRLARMDGGNFRRFIQDDMVDSFSAPVELIRELYDSLTLQRMTAAKNGKVFSSVWKALDSMRNHLTLKLAENETDSQNPGLIREYLDLLGHFKRHAGKAFKQASHDYRFDTMRLQSREEIQARGFQYRPIPFDFPNPDKLHDFYITLFSHLQYPQTRHAPTFNDYLASPEKAKGRALAVSLLQDDKRLVTFLEKVVTSGRVISTHEKYDPKLKHMYIHVLNQLRHDKPHLAKDMDDMLKAI